ncbi:BrnT family toxin [Sinorhizobium meliloti]|nr:BrnT family toxin [Sinorhizobium meliloti]WKL30885.1 BrnT family toxin [Sinorhizobium meliloti]WKL36553.1 BrnT family toxin [Sinorhizobium meliloti]
MKIAGIDWDHGNWPKCGKHGVSKDHIEHAMRNMTFRVPDPNPAEPRFRTASRAPDGRPVFIVYTHREREGLFFLRPISARYMHGKEVTQYEQIEKSMAKPADR